MLAASVAGLWAAGAAAPSVGQAELQAEDPALRLGDRQEEADLWVERQAEGQAVDPEALLLEVEVIHSVWEEEHLVGGLSAVVELLPEAVERHEAVVERPEAVVERPEVVEEPLSSSRAEHPGVGAVDLVEDREAGAKAAPSQPVGLSSKRLNSRPTGRR